MNVTLNNAPEHLVGVVADAQPLDGPCLVNARMSTEDATLVPTCAEAGMVLVYFPGWAPLVITAATLATDFTEV